MFGITFIKTKKLHDLYEHSAHNASELLKLSRRMAEVAGYRNHAEKRMHYISSTNRTPASKGDAYRRILNELLNDLRGV